MEDLGAQILIFEHVLTLFANVLLSSRTGQIEVVLQQEVLLDLPLFLDRNLGLSRGPDGWRPHPHSGNQQESSSGIWLLQAGWSWSSEDLAGQEEDL